MRLLFLCVFLFSIAHSGIGQQLHNELEFLNYLMNTRNYNDAEVLLNNIKPDTQSEMDSVYYLTGKIHYLNQNLDLAVNEFNKLNNSLTKPIHSYSKFYNALCKAYQGKYESGLTDLNSLSLNDSLLINLRKLELGGIYLLQRDLKSFNDISTSYQGNYYQTSSQEKSLMLIGEDLSQRKEKSPFVAGLMSAIIPGSGRMYAGKTGMGIATLLTTAILGLQTWEGYDKDGIDSPRFIIFGSLFSLAYVGNIWGSVFTVKISNNDFNKAVNNRILIDLHIPLRNIID
ncbi:TM2 domain-containing protein [Fulvivirga lutea]|uniref:TM2 domain-containing protein n=1 Tax=Fulvivirga lutea TaxID=2810512 RepID=A0A974ZZC1_9BACT|nr:hypothetical protein [Fulvivirga lutea]QSE95994.1 hypothetical protein JR347_10230 [Fulvivirga lutea]